MAKESTVKSFHNKPPYEYGFIMDKSIDELRKAIWNTIFNFMRSSQISECDISMALGIVQYELFHHSDEGLK